jgi:hypothetical protein
MRIIEVLVFCTTVTNSSTSKQINFHHHEPDNPRRAYFVRTCNDIIEDPAKLDSMGLEMANLFESATRGKLSSKNTVVLCHALAEYLKDPSTKANEAKEQIDQILKAHSFENIKLFLKKAVAKIF